MMRDALRDIDGHAGEDGATDTQTLAAGIGPPTAEGVGAAAVERDIHDRPAVERRGDSGDGGGGERTRDGTAPLPVQGRPDARAVTFDAAAVGGDAERRAAVTFGCCECGKRFKTSMALKMHWRRKHGAPKPAPSVADGVCEQCGWSGAGGDALLLDIHCSMQHPVEHWRRLVNDKKGNEVVPPKDAKATNGGTAGTRRECETCGIWLKNGHTYKQHKKRHVGEIRPFKCAHCVMRFKKLAHATNHALVKHGRTGPPTEVKAAKMREVRTEKCDRCKEQFNSRMALKAHIRRKHRGRVYTCKSCGNVFGRSQTLAIHVRHEHKGEQHSGRRPSDLHDDVRRPHECSHCGMRFVARQQMWDHKNAVHLGILNYGCPYCRKRFSFSTGVCYHKKICPMRP